MLKSLLIAVLPLLATLGLLTYTAALLSPAAAGFIILAALAGILPMLFLRQPSSSEDLATTLSELERQQGIKVNTAVPANERLQHLASHWQQHATVLENRVQARLAILEHLPTPLLMLDNETRLVRANAAGRQLFGLSDDTPIAGNPVATILRDPPVLEAIDRANKEDIRELLDVHLNGRYYQLQIEPVPARPFIRTKMVLILNDITAIYRNDQAHASFVAHASHELRTPLAAIIGFIETLQGPAKNDTAAVEEFLSIMHEQASRMQRLIRDLLALSRMEARQPEFQHIDLLPLLENVVTTQRTSIRNQEHAIELVKDAKKLTVQGNADSLAQVFHNLVDNAVRYGTPGSPVTITAHQENDDIAISVTNEGEGIPVEEIPQLTERFYRAKSATTQPGTGLGLAIVKQAVEQHSGPLRIISEPGGKTAFTVLLPQVEKSI